MNIYKRPRKKKNFSQFLRWYFEDPRARSNVEFLFSLLLQLDDAALQLYKDGDYSSYLDLDSSIAEQQDEFEGFQPKYVLPFY